MTADALLLGREVLDSLQEGLYVLDSQRRIIFWNKSAEMITGFPSQEVLGRSCSDNILVHVDDMGTWLCQGLCPLAHTLEDGDVREAEIFLRPKDGHRVPVFVRAAPLRNPEGKITGAVELFWDNSSHHEEHHRLRELEKLALLDPLTRMPNRRYLEELILSRLGALRRAGLQFGVLLIGVDHCSEINELHGRKVGNVVLKAVANTLSHVSLPYDVMGYWGGGKFLSLVPNANLENLTQVARRYQALVQSSRIVCDPGDMNITISLGGALARPDDDAESLFARAEQNFNRAKEAGLNQLFVD